MLWLRRVPWQLSCVVFAMAMAASAEITASNSSTEIQEYSGLLMLEDASGMNISQLVPLTQAALTIRNHDPLSGNLFNTNNDTVDSLTSQEISYISCNQADYSGGLDPSKLLEQAMGNHNLTAVILYSTTSDFCGYNDPTEQLQEFAVFSMTKRSESEDLLNSITGLRVAEKFFVTIRHLGQQQSDSSDSNRPQQNPLGPSPSTAVAMIILYSITGIITALFLVIIITGAIRAHRHPDRYGPRDVLGRPRQSRARGLGRAILDTIPIVKFGEREQEQPKPADVELGSTSEARNVENANATGNASAGTQDAAHAGTAETVETSGGIAPALPVAAAGASTEDGTAAEENPSCSICADDFLKGQDIRLLPCGHQYHPECVDPWLLNVSSTCPLCRVDLRPPEARTSTSTSDDNGDLDPNTTNTLTPPLNPNAETDVSHRRRSALRDILGFRSRPNASPEERISALRRLRELRRTEGETESGEGADAVTQRRSRRISARLSGVFGGSSRARQSIVGDGAGGTQTPSLDAAGVAGGENTTASTSANGNQRADAGPSREQQQ